MSLSAGNRIYQTELQQLDTVGDGTGTKNIIQDYTGNPTIIRYRPPRDKIFQLQEFNVQYSDQGAFQQNVYASLPNPLTVGVRIDIYDRDDNIIAMFTDGNLVTRNDEWYRLGYNFFYNDWAGSNQNTLVASLIASDFGTSLTIDGTVAHSIGVLVQDDFTSLVSQTFTVKGYFR